MDLAVKMIFLVSFVFVFVIGTPATAFEDIKRDELVKWGGYGEDKLSTVVIGGKLLCSSGSHGKTARNPYPVSGASVAVFCGTGTSFRMKKSWAKGSTDRYGEFLIDLPSHLHAIPNLEKICVVRVVHLPQSSPCRQAFTGKHKGIKLASVGEGVRFYTTHDMHVGLKPSQEHVRKGIKTKVIKSVV